MLREEDVTDELLAQKDAEIAALRRELHDLRGGPPDIEMHAGYELLSDDQKPASAPILSIELDDHHVSHAGMNDDLKAEKKDTNATAGPSQNMLDNPGYTDQNKPAGGDMDVSLGISPTLSDTKEDKKSIKGKQRETPSLPLDFDDMHVNLDQKKVEPVLGGDSPMRKSRREIPYVELPSLAVVQRKRAAARRRAATVPGSNSNTPVASGSGNTSVKAEPMDVDLPLDAAGQDNGERPDVLMTEEDEQKAVEGLENPVVKVKKELRFDYKLIADRLKPYGLGQPEGRFPIPLEESVRNVSYTRYYISAMYGGNSMETFPRPSQDMIDLHGLDGFLMLSRRNHPHAPQFPGDLGLFFTHYRATEDWPEPMRVFVMLRPGVWLYAGVYKMFRSDSLSPEEFSRQRLVKKSWSEQLMKHDWGVGVRVRAWARRNYDVMPSEKKLKNMYDDPEIVKKATAALDWKDIAKQYEDGFEEIGVYCMKCVGYDPEFQRVLAENTANYVPPHLRRKTDAAEQTKPKAQAKRGKKAPPASVPKSRPKRKQPEPEWTDEEDEESDSVIFIDDSEHDSEIEIIENFMGRGTRSRPRKGASGSKQ